MHVETEWMVSVCMCMLSRTACMMKQPLYDCGVRALRSETCRLHVEIEVPLLWTQAVRCSEKHLGMRRQFSHRRL